MNIPDLNFGLKILKFLDANPDLVNPGHGIWDEKKIGSGIRDKHSGSATLHRGTVN